MTTNVPFCRLRDLSGGLAVTICPINQLLNFSQSALARSFREKCPQPPPAHSSMDMRETSLPPRRSHIVPKAGVTIKVQRGGFAGGETGVRRREGDVQAAHAFRP